MIICHRNPMVGSSLVRVEVAGGAVPFYLPLWEMSQKKSAIIHLRQDDTLLSLNDHGVGAAYYPGDFRFLFLPGQKGFAEAEGFLADLGKATFSKYELVAEKDSFWFYERGPLIPSKQFDEGLFVASYIDRNNSRPGRLFGP